MTQATSKRGNAPKDVILGFLAHEDPNTVWGPLGADGKFWFRRDTFVALLNADRITVQSYNGASGVLHATLDGEPIIYTISLFGIAMPGMPELTV